MWPLDLFAFRSRKRWLIHVAAHHVQAYLKEHGRWIPHQRYDLDPQPVAAWPHLESALQQLKLLVDADSFGHITLLLDSHWAPVCWVPAGQQPFAPQAFLAMAQHRFSRVHGSSAQSWHIQSNYLVGDPSALAFALPDGLQASLMNMLGDKVTIEPTLARVMQAWPGDAQQGLAHQALIEDDRMVLLTWHCGQLLGCHPAVNVPASLDDLQTLLSVERSRLAMEATLTSDTAQLTWVYSLQTSAGWPQASQVIKTAAGDVHWRLGLPGQGAQA